MANPKFQDPDNASVEFLFPDAALPVYPSNDPSKPVRFFYSRNKLRRQGVLVYDALFTEREEWEFILQNVAESTVYHTSNETLETFARMGTFYYFPDSGSATKYLVEWVNNSEFNPEQRPGATYNIRFVLRAAEDT